MNYRIHGELLRMINLFRRNKVDHILFKCEHILEGQNKNLDLVMRNRTDFHKASYLLEKSGYALYMPESTEKYKKMYVKVTDKLYAVHIHREVAWHGIKAMDKEIIFERKIKIAPGIFVPSPEDSLMIHVAHIIFENHKIGRTKKRLLKIVKGKVDWKYIGGRLKKVGWTSIRPLPLQT